MEPDYQEKRRYVNNVRYSVYYSLIQFVKWVAYALIGGLVVAFLFSCLVYWPVKMLQGEPQHGGPAVTVTFFFIALAITLFLIYRFTRGGNHERTTAR